MWLSSYVSYGDDLNFKSNDLLNKTIKTNKQTPTFAHAVMSCMGVRNIARLISSKRLR